MSRAWAYYNEHDRFAAAWLRELMIDNLIAAGEVDERSIEDVTPDDIRSFRQCHFFAGIGVWSIAARIAGWDDDAPLWSGSCPCQPFSAAGKGEGFADERHLWPAFHYLIEQRSPSLIVGEQVAGADGDAWLDLVSSDMDATGYAFGAAETVAAGFGAPHKRTRNYWLAHRIGAGLEGQRRHGDDWHQPGRIGTIAAGSVAAGGVPHVMADDDRDGQRASGNAGRDEPERHPQSGGAVCRLDDASSARHLPTGCGQSSELESDGRIGRGLSRMGCSLNDHGRPGPVNGLWGDADWLRCRDERWRAVEPGTFPLADAGTFRNRVGLLRGAGNAITLGQAVGFLKAVRESLTR